LHAGPIPAELAQCTALDNLNLSYNQLTGTCARLDCLVLWNFTIPPLSVITGELPIGVIKMKVQGVKVVLRDNIGFTLPANMSELGAVEELNLSSCSLKGMFAFGLHEWHI
jgi:hypothetical protein